MRRGCRYFLYLLGLASWIEVQARVVPDDVAPTSTGIVLLVVWLGLSGLTLIVYLAYRLGLGHGQIRASRRKSLSSGDKQSNSEANTYLGLPGQVACESLREITTDASSWLSAVSGKDDSDTLAEARTDEDDGFIDVLSPALIRAHILVVENEPSTRTLLAGTLESMAHEVVFAVNGVQALALAAQQMFDMVLLDTDLPQLNGFDTCRRLRETADALSLPVLMISAQHEAADILSALDAGANDYIAKPVRAAELKARVQTLLTLRHVNQLRRQRNEVAEQASAVMRLSLHRAQTEPLTGLPNRQQAQRRFAELLQVAVNEHKCLLLMMVGIDDFASVNETLGHDAGDQFLKACAGRLRDLVRDSDLVARWGADQFLLVFFLSECSAPH